MVVCFKNNRTLSDTQWGSAATKHRSTWKWISNALELSAQLTLFSFPLKVVDPTPFHIQAEVTMKTNFFGTQDVCKELLPIIKPQGESGPAPLPLCTCLSATWRCGSAPWGLIFCSHCRYLCIPSSSLTFQYDSKVPWFHLLTPEGVLGFQLSQYTSHTY